MLRARLSLALVFVILNPGLNKALSYGQQGSGEVPSITFRTNTRLVMIDAVVTDKKGQPVTGLKAEDFIEGISRGIAVKPQIIQRDKRHGR